MTVLLVLSALLAAAAAWNAVSAGRQLRRATAELHAATLSRSDMLTDMAAEAKTSSEEQEGRLVRLLELVDRVDRMRAPTARLPEPLLDDLDDAPMHVHLRALSDAGFLIDMLADYENPFRGKETGVHVHLPLEKKFELLAFETPPSKSSAYPWRGPVRKKPVVPARRSRHHNLAY
jgi:hypothetical protein